MAYLGAAHFAPVHRSDLKSKPHMKSVGFFHDCLGEAEWVIRQRPHHSKPNRKGTRGDRVHESCVRSERLTPPKACGSAEAKLVGVVPTFVT